MKRSRRQAIVVAAGSLTALATLSARAQQRGDEAAVTEAVEKLRAAMVSADRGQLEALTAPELSYGHSGGVVESRAQFVDVIASKRTAYKTITLTDQSVAIAGDNAIARHVFSTDFESGGTPGSSRVGVLQVWQRRDGQWRLLARQAFRI
jgi:hypothetical protein